MIIRSLEDIENTAREVEWGNGQSRRFLLEQDGMGFTLTDTIVEAATEALIQYRNHLEACYCISGDGEVETMDGTIHPITTGTMYAPDEHDTHYLRGGEEDMRLICVFSPALRGPEAHRLEAAAEEETISSY